MAFSGIISVDGDTIIRSGLEQGREHSRRAKHVETEITVDSSDYRIDMTTHHSMHGLGVSPLTEVKPMHLCLRDPYTDKSNVPLLESRSDSQAWKHLTESQASSFERQDSLGDGLCHAAGETYLCTRWILRLLRYLGIGYRWMVNFAALALYALFLMPGFIQVAWCYFFDKRIHRGISYGQGARNRLDLYIPENLETPKPVVAFVSGGAWIIGYKAWGSLLGLQLLDEDVIVACIDYRNFPQGTISDMMEDVSQGISFISNNIANYGGDPNRLYLAGQSAGAHIAACVLVEQARKQSEQGDVEIANQGCEGSLMWKAAQFQAYFGLSGCYNLLNLASHFHNRGFDNRLFLSIMEGEGSLLQYSPELRLQGLSTGNAGPLLPPIYLFHGDHDLSIPCDSSISFAEALKSVGAKVSAKIYEGKSHTDLFLQDPMRGGSDELLTDILSIVFGEDRTRASNSSLFLRRRRMVPELCLQFAHRVSPF